MIDWHNFLVYDESSPSGLRWKVDLLWGRNGNEVRVSTGDVAGSLMANGYYITGLHRKTCLNHRIVYNLFNPDCEMVGVIDHVDGNSQNNRIENLRETTQRANARNMVKFKTNSSGVTGVSLTSPNGAGKPYWRARWHDLDGTPRQKLFAVSLYGNDDAFRLACEYRSRMIEELNAQGAGYTERHGI